MITLDFDPIRDALFDWIHTAVNGSLSENDANSIPVRRAEEGSVAEDGEAYIEYKFLTGLIAVGLKDELRYDKDQDKFFLFGRREFSVQVEAFGDKAPECVAQIQQGLSAPNICEILRNAGIAVIDDNVISDATLFLETEYEPRALLDVRMSTALQNFDIVDGLGTIDSVGLVNEIYSTPLEVTINKP